MWVSLHSRWTHLIFWKLKMVHQRLLPSHLIVVQDDSSVSSLESLSESTVSSMAEDEAKIMKRPAFVRRSTYCCGEDLLPRAKTGISEARSFSDYKVTSRLDTLDQKRMQSDSLGISGSTRSRSGRKLSLRKRQSDMLQDCSHTSRNSDSQASSRWSTSQTDNGPTTPLRIPLRKKSPPFPRNSSARTNKSSETYRTWASNHLDPSLKNARNTRWNAMAPERGSHSLCKSPRTLLEMEQCLINDGYFLPQRET